MLKLLYGKAGADVSSHIYEKIKSEGSRAILLVPDQFSMFCEKKIISTLGAQAQTYVEVLSFSRLSNKILNHTGPLRLEYLDKPGKNMLAQKVLNECGDKLTVLKRASVQKGFATVLTGAISEFKRYDISADKLGDYARDIKNDAKDEMLGAKLSDLSMLYARYQKYIDEKYSDSEDNLSFIRKKIQKCDFLDGTNIYIDYFKSFTPAEYGVMEELMKKSDVFISLCCDDIENTEDTSVFAPCAKTYQKLCVIAEQNGITVESPQFFDRSVKFKENPELSFIADEYHKHEIKTYDKEVKNIQIISPQNYYEEVEAVARLINKLIRDNSYRFRDICVLSRNLEAYSHIIESVFKSFELKFFLDQKRDSGRNPLIAAFISVLSILSYGFSYERVMTLLRSGFIRCAKNDIDVFENYILEAGISHGNWEKTEEWQYVPQKTEYNMETVNSVRYMVTRPILNLKKSITGRKTVNEIIDGVYTYLEDINAYKTIRIKSLSFIRQKRREKADEYRQMWNLLINMLEQMRNIMGEDFVTYVKFADIVSAGLEEVQAGLIPPTLDQILVSEIERFRNHDAKVTIIIGANNGVFPKVFNNEGLISDSDREKLLTEGMVLASGSQGMQMEEENLVYSVLTSPANKLYIFAPMSDSEGRGLKPSPVIGRLKQMFPKLKTEETEIDEIEGRNSAFNKLCIKMAEQIPLPRVWLNVKAYFENNIDYRDKLEWLTEALKIGENMPKISKSTARKIYGEALWLSVSKLEKYCACEFSFFLRYGLLASSRKFAGLFSQDIGSVLHKAVAIYFTNLNSSQSDDVYSSITRKQCESDMGRIIGEITQEELGAFYKELPKMKYQTERIKAIGAITAWSVVNFYRRSKFRPLGFEISFAPDGNYNPQNIEIGETKAKLTAFIDRVDVGEVDGVKYVSVVDYKSSQKSLDLDFVEKGLQLQPLVYTNMLLEQIKNSDSCAMLYMKMDDPVINFDTSEIYSSGGFSEDKRESDEIMDLKIEKEVLKKMRMKGWVLSDGNVLNSLDSGEGGISAIQKDNRGCRGERRHVALSREIFKERLRVAESKLKEAAAGIAGGEIRINPVRIGKYRPCNFCEYKGVCGGPRKLGD